MDIFCGARELSLTCNVAEIEWLQSTSEALADMNTVLDYFSELEEVI